MRPFATLPRNAAIVAAFNTLVALSITLVQRESGLLDNFVFSQCIGMPVYLTVDLPRRAFWPRGMGSFADLLGLATLGMLVGYFGGTALAAAILGYPWQPAALNEPDAGKTVVLTLWVGVLGSWFFCNRARRAAARRSTSSLGSRPRWPRNSPTGSRCVARLKSALAQPAGLDALLAQLRALAPPPPGAELLRQIQAGVGNAVRIILLEDVCYFRAGDKYTAVATRDGAEALIRAPLKELLARLPAGRFRQVHRGSIVNMVEVAEALRDDAGRGSLRLKHREETLPVSRLYAELFRQM